jgi:two-component system response regulator NreC
VTIRVLIADDHGVLRAGVRVLLTRQEDIEVVGEADDGATAVELAERLEPDVVLLDVNMPGMNGVEATEAITEALPDCRVLLLTIREDSVLLRQAIEAGIAGYVPKRAVESEMINAIRAVHRGEMYIHPSMTRAFVALLSPTMAEPVGAEVPLTGQEVDVLRGIAQGYTNQQIADQMAVSVRTVERQRASLRDKLGISSRAALVRYAREHGLLD